MSCPITASVGLQEKLRKNPDNHKFGDVHLLKSCTRACESGDSLYECRENTRNMLNRPKHRIKNIGFGIVDKRKESRVQGGFGLNEKSNRL